MPHRVVWNVTRKTHGRIVELTHQLHNLAITEAHWLDEVMRLPNYPLPGKPGRDDELVIVLTEPTHISVPHTRVQ